MGIFTAKRLELINFERKYKFGSVERTGMLSGVKIDSSASIAGKNILKYRPKVFIT